MRRSKYGNKRTTVDGITFDSKAEAMRWLQLKALEKRGVIRALERQTPIDVTYEGVKLFRYRADFAYFEGQERIYEDVKGVMTPVFRLKARVIKAMLKINIRITGTR
jgi:hypothetical protein